jgi:hypothetical protein
MDGMVAAAADVLVREAAAGDACDVARASICLGVLQDALLAGQPADLQARRERGRRKGSRAYVSLRMPVRARRTQGCFPSPPARTTHAAHTHTHKNTHTHTAHTHTHTHTLARTHTQQHTHDVTQPNTTKHTLQYNTTQHRTHTNTRGRDGTVHPCAPQAEVAACEARFAADLVGPALAKAARAKGLEQALAALTKHLWTRLAKAPAHKQPAHAQFLTSALRPAGARRLDCVGIATAALALCRAAAAADPERLGALARAELLLSDDHSWLRVPYAPAAGGSGGGGKGAKAAAQDIGGWLHFEATDCRALRAEQMDGRWL